MRGAKSRFTLIEMLVVIGILAILASLLMPSLLKALEQGKTISCANNLRQAFYALLSYAGDQNQIVPTRGAQSSGGWEGACFYGTIYPSTTTAPADYWLCPSIPNKEREAWMFRITRKTYATFVATGLAANGTMTDYNYRLNRVRKPGVTPFVLDSLASDGRMYCQIWDALGGFIGMLHNGASNVCFVDGHVDLLDMDKWGSQAGLLEKLVYPSTAKVLYPENLSTPLPVF